MMSPKCHLACMNAAAVFVLALSAPVRAGGIGCHDPIARAQQRPIDLVICLDTSGSMEGLIDSARARLWDIVTSLSTAKPTPLLRVGLITYGSPNNSSPAQGWVVPQLGLTRDLDSLYAKMMAFRTDGGDELVGWALRDAIYSMDWSNDPNALKLIFVAGNESADQGRNHYDFRDMGRHARARGITINSIYCGENRLGVQEMWHDVAEYGGGKFSSIDMKCGTIQIDAPQDKLLLELNMKLNATYVPFGDKGSAGFEQQAKQDLNARKMAPAALAQRVAAKGTQLYSNTHWDLVDAVAEKKVDLKDLKDSDLPPAMQKQTLEEREQFVVRQRLARADIQKQIAELNGQREQFVAKKRAESAGGKQALDQAMLETIRTQAKSKGFKFE